MRDVFDDLFSEILDNRDDLSQVFHGTDDTKPSFIGARVLKMSNQELINFIRIEAEHRLKQQGVTMNAVEFFKRVAMCGRKVREEVPEE